MSIVHIYDIYICVYIRIEHRERAEVLNDTNSKNLYVYIYNYMYIYVYTSYVYWYVCIVYSYDIHMCVYIRADHRQRAEVRNDTHYTDIYVCIYNSIYIYIYIFIYVYIYMSMYI